MRNIKAARSAKGMTQEQLADQLNVTRISVARYESGDREPSISILEKMADILETSTDYLIGREKTMRDILDEDPITAGVSTLAANGEEKVIFDEDQKRELQRIIRDAILQHDREHTAK